MSFLHLKEVAKENDVVIVWGGRDCISCITLKKGSVFQNQRGTFPHDFFIDAPYGSKVLKHLHQLRDQILSKNNKGWVYLLTPSAELWTRALKHRTQILYAPDISLISFMLDLKPGQIVIESGTGSGSLSTAIARCIAPSGKLYTFEINPEREAAAKVDFKTNQLEEVITVTLRNVCEEGFGKELQNVANAVFLDLPSPWQVIQSAKETLVEGGRFCGFSPCIEQVQKTCEQLRKHNFVDIKTVECLLRPYEVRSQTLQAFPMVSNASSNKRKRSEEEESVLVKHSDEQQTSGISTYIISKPLTSIAGHTGYLTFATLESKN